MFIRKNLRARRELQYASTLALSGIPNNGRGGKWLMHAMEHALSGHYDIAHGRGLAVVIPRIMRYACKTVPHRYALLGERCFGITDGGEMEKAEAAISAFVRWLDGIGENLTLGDLDIGDEKFETIAEDIVRNYGDGRKFTYVMDVDREALIEIYRMCLEANG